MRNLNIVLRHLTNKSAITRMQAILLLAIIVIAGAAAYYLMLPVLAPVKKIAVVSDVGGRGDLSFNDMGFKGGAEAEKAFGVKMVELISKTEADYVPNVEAAAKDPDVILVVAVGFLLSDALNKTAAKYPDKNFVGIDTFTWIVSPGQAYFPPNLINIQYDEHKGSAIVGAIATLVAAHYGYAHIGAVLGMEIPVLWKFEIGYKWGVDWAIKWYQNKFGKSAPVIGDTPAKERVLYTYTGTFSDITKGYEAAKAIYAQNAVAVYNIAGPLGIGINQAVQEIATAKGLTMGPPFWIGVDADQDWLNPGFVLCSMLKRVDKGVYFATQLTLEGKFRQVAKETQGMVYLGFGTNIGGIAVEGIEAPSTLANLDEFIQMGTDAEKQTGMKVLPMSPEEIKATAKAVRDALPSWIWDAATELGNAIRSNPDLVPRAVTQEAVNQWRATLG